MFLECLGIFAGGVIVGKVGSSVLGSKKAKKVYSHTLAAVLRGKDSVMKTTAAVKENCGDIYASAKDINDKKYEEKAARRIEEAKAALEEAKAILESNAPAENDAPAESTEQAE